MYTKRTLENLGGLNKKFRIKAEEFLIKAQVIALKHGITIEIISGYRNPQQQAALYAQGRTKAGKIVTKARPWKSWHNYGLAIDLGLFAAGKYLDESSPARADKIYKELGVLAVSLGIEWAGNWKTFTESPHFQWTNGKTRDDLKAKMILNNYDVNKIL